MLYWLLNCSSNSIIGTFNLTENINPGIKIEKLSSVIREWEPINTEIEIKIHKRKFLNQQTILL